MSMLFATFRMNVNTAILREDTGDQQGKLLLALSLYFIARPSSAAAQMVTTTQMIVLRFQLTLSLVRLLRAHGSICQPQLMSSVFNVSLAFDLKASRNLSPYQALSCTSSYLASEMLVANVGFLIGHRHRRHHPSCRRSTLTTGTAITDDILR
ncbi:hypothetical protein BKA62DRAFT_186725 [Auriculariales sp. MPI-PUGE-AT-0066]|nr:hypothetical protein BKA62DRAFT_186725 [Auriculariales sp. MPI-PUGE-AT-0066]